jgi:hypothetical protein
MLDEIKSHSKEEVKYIEAINAQIELEIELVRRKNDVQENRFQPTGE